jgi:hypothetical protein
MRKTYRGSCHCGAVRFECELDLASADTSRCNCSICARTRYWKTLVKAENFRLLEGADALAEYQFGSNTIRHRFCKTCGVKTFGQAHFDMTFMGEPMKGDYYAINLMCLDASDAELASAPLRFEDGRNNDWEHAPAVTSHL